MVLDRPSVALERVVGDRNDAEVLFSDESSEIAEIARRTEEDEHAAVGEEVVQGLPEEPSHRPVALVGHRRLEEAARRKPAEWRIEDDEIERFGDR